MPETLCRVAVHHDGNTVDLALPCDVGVVQLLPSIVEIVCEGTDPGANEGRWRLHRSCGTLLDEELTLGQNGIEDGDLLWLNTEHLPALRWTERDACHVVAKAAVTGPSAASVWAAVSVTAATVGAGVLVWAAHASSGAACALAAVVSAAAIGGALVLRRGPHSPLTSSVCGLIAVLFAAVSGAIAVPAGAVAASVLLASAAACSVSTLWLRVTGYGTASFIALATAAGLVAIVCMVGVLSKMAPVAVGTSLTVLSLAGLGAAPRIIMVIHHITPTLDAAPPEVDEGRATGAHTAMTGLVAGTSVAVTVGAVLIAYGQASRLQSAAVAAAFTGTVGVALMLRARSHAVPARKCVLIACGTLCAAIAVAITAWAYPVTALWLSMFGVVAAAAALTPLFGPSGPLLRRVAEISEYAALAAVVPLGCWLAGVYRLVRDAALL
ncbi:type VII secretion integral membrane protein EccD [Mycobacterium sp. IDR2000157661]|uniref:type VII secretion integral membrane protein EccD n=1 Tax=Mycobacterium sp. IDR2000157661 TaxID=2867005 RepID=UPI001EEB0648|nr:type VII secretion integral membrane protein EccD [Mycobacterium sp. IDR2000157661]ULE33787.1 type VII secretion integral membrane protein EccD [Mycobacterium sp. IDR2000157661]